MESCHKLTGGYSITGGESKFYQKPLETDLIPGDIIQTESANNLNTCDLYSNVKEICPAKYVSISTQTDFRESEAQTDPWDPPHIVVGDIEYPEILSLKYLTFGNGLPVTLLEMNHLMESRKNKKIRTELSTLRDEDTLEKKKQNISEQIRSDWNYKLSVLNEKQLKKLMQMEEAVSEQILSYCNKKDKILQNLWNSKKNEINKQCFRLHAKLQKDLRSLETVYLKNHFGDPSKREKKLEEEVTTKPAFQKEFSSGIDYLLSSYYTSNPKSLLAVKEWLQTKKEGLRTEIPLPRVIRKSQREKIAESAFKSIKGGRRARLPPVAYREDYVPEEAPPAPAPRAEDVLELFDLGGEERVDLVTVWQKVLRGRAVQKQASGPRSEGVCRVRSASLCGTALRTGSLRNQGVYRSRKSHKFEKRCWN